MGFLEKKYDLVVDYINRSNRLRPFFPDELRDHLIKDKSDILHEIGIWCVLKRIEEFKESGKPINELTINDMRRKIVDDNEDKKEVINNG
jgi:uncharacterized protein YutD